MSQNSQEINIKLSLNTIRTEIQNAKSNRSKDLQDIEPTLVAVSKTKPVELIIEAYKEGQRHFGENYPQELILKAKDSRILEMCKEIKWHFIGHLQSNKAAKVVTLPNLFMIETLDSEKIASVLNDCQSKHANVQLNVFIQVNTSSEAEKNGVPPSEVVALSKYVIEKCPYLKFCGLMTIGTFGHDLSEGPNPDFLTLNKCKEDVCRALDLPLIEVGLSMGMSDDFEHAIQLGSSNVRVGSSIFGYREKKQS